jgi:hypothetical protein
MQRLRYFGFHLRRLGRRVSRWVRRRPVPAVVPRPPAPPGPPRVAFSYTVYWTRQARTWDAARRAAVAQAVAAALAQPGFEPNDYERRYTVPALDNQAHAGASLAALGQVLAALAHQPEPAPGGATHVR